MKKYRCPKESVICAMLILFIALVCFGAGFLARRPEGTEESSVLQSPAETETEAETRVVINQMEVEPVVTMSAKEEFYLVSETGYLLVFAQDQSTICLYTHIPISEFPEKEQEKLRAGIWFSSMMEIFHYLESYTS